MTLASRLAPLAALVSLALLMSPAASLAQEAEPGAEPENVEETSPGAASDPFADIDFTTGPETSKLGKQAEIAVPADWRFAGAKDARRLLEIMGNPTSGSELGFMVPPDGEWFVVFEWSDVGYVKDDDKDKLDADAILDSIKKGTAAANEERKERGWSTLEIVGWEYPPRYDPETNNLEWAVRAESEGHAVVNYNTRLLGRKGVMEAALVIDPEQLAAALPSYKSLLAGYHFREGERYAEFSKGDKIAKYGLAGLVAGGAAAVALKSGLLQKFGKLIVVGVLGLGAAVKRLFYGGGNTTDKA